MVSGGLAYIIMVLGNWAAVDDDVGAFSIETQRGITLWIHQFLAFAVCGIYIWSLFAARHFR